MSEWRHALVALTQKYRALIVLCRERDDFEARGVLRLSGEARAERHGRARALARRFPGALRELDGATVRGLSERLAQIEAELSLGRERAAAPRWMSMVVEFHAELRGLLRIKGAVAQGESVTPAEAALIASPPYGRLQELVWQRLAERYGVSPEVVRATVQGGQG